MRKCNSLEELIKFTQEYLTLYASKSPSFLHDANKTEQKKSIVNEFLKKKEWKSLVDETEKGKTTVKMFNTFITLISNFKGSFDDKHLNRYPKKRLGFFKRDGDRIGALLGGQLAGYDSTGDRIPAIPGILEQAEKLREKEDKPEEMRSFA